MRSAHVIVDLGWGDSGKGTMTDALCRFHGADIVIRFNGANQAAHNVVTADGTHHCFSHYGSGALAGIPTHLSRFMFIEPLALEAERRELATAGGNSALSIDPNCVIITPFHRYLNQALERVQHHGSVGIGFGVARMGVLEGWALRVGMLADGVRTKARLEALRRWCLTKLRMPDAQVRSEAQQQMWAVDVVRLAERYREILGNAATMKLTSDVIGAYYVGVFEGAQGVLLDETHGCIPPHVSWSSCTFGNALELLRGHDVAVERIGVIRSYYTRHGAGPFPSEAVVPGSCERHNITHEWMGPFRTGHFDQFLFDYAVQVCGGIDSLAVTHMDVPFSGQVCVRHEGSAPVYRSGVPHLEPRYLSWGPRSDQKEIIARKVGAA